MQHASEWVSGWVYECVCVCLQMQSNVAMSSASLFCFKKSSIQPKFKNYTLIVAFCQYRKDISSKIKSFEKKFFSITWIRERKNTRQESTVITVILNVEIKITFHLHLELRCPISTVSPENRKKNHRKTWSFFKASYTQTSHWHFSSVFISTIST